MTISMPVRSAVLEVVQRLRDPQDKEPLSAFLHDAFVGSLAPAYAPLREGMGCSNSCLPFGRWISSMGMSREEVAAALELVAKE